MATEKYVSGDPVEVPIGITITHTFESQHARSFLFSVRNVSLGVDASPVTILVTGFTSAGRDVPVTRAENRSGSEVDLWVDVLDIPVGDPMTITALAGSTQAGAFKLEALVMPFDKDYRPVYDSTGAQASLFSYTLLGVNKPTAAERGGAFGAGTLGKRLPGFEAGSAVLAGMAATALVAGRPPRASGPRMRGDVAMDVPQALTTAGCEAAETSRVSDWGSQT
jgi:hypothetical protein